MLKHTQNTIKIDLLNSNFCFPVNWEMKNKYAKIMSFNPRYN